MRSIDASSLKQEPCEQSSPHILQEKKKRISKKQAAPANNPQSSAEPASTQPNLVDLKSIYKKIFKMTRTQNKSKKILKPEEYEREQLSKYRLDYTWLPSQRNIQSARSSEETGVYYLCGGVSIEMSNITSNIPSCEDPTSATLSQPQQNQQHMITNAPGNSRSILNDYMQVLGVEIFEEKGLVEVKLQNTQKGLTDFRFLSQKFQNSMDEQQRDFGCEIEAYATFIEHLLKRKELCEGVAGFNQFSEIVSNKLDQFDAFLAEQINRVSSTHRIFTYRVYKFDLFDFEFKMKSYGYSEDFIKTLGYSRLSQFKDLIMHQGIPEIFTLETRQNIAKAHMASIAKKQRDLQQIPCKLISLDSIEVETHVDMHLIPFYDSNTPIYNSLFDCSAMIEISVYDIAKTALRQVVDLRKQINFDFNDAVKQDIYYELESQLFVDKFYTNNPLKIKKQLPLTYLPPTLPLSLAKNMSKCHSEESFDDHHHTDDTDHGESSGHRVQSIPQLPESSKVCAYRMIL